MFRPTEISTVGVASTKAALAKRKAWLKENILNRNQMSDERKILVVTVMV
jgi:hypothetical protein